MAFTIDPSILALINNAADVNTAVTILRANDITDPNIIATYLASSKFYSDGADPNITALAGKLNGSKGGSNVMTLLTIPTSAVGALGIVNMVSPNLIKPGGAVLGEFATGALAAFMEYEVFASAEKASEKGTPATAALLGAVFLGAVFTTMLFLSKLLPMVYNVLPIINPVNILQAWAVLGPAASLIGPGHALVMTVAQSIATAQFHHALLLATAITTAILAAGVIAGLPGSKGADTTPTGAAISSMLGQIPAWYNSLPSASVAMISAGLTIAGTGYSLSPGSVFQQFSVPTVGVAQAATDAGTPGASIFVLPAQNKGGFDTVYVVTPGSGGNSTLSVFQVDSNGYLVAANGPDQNYLAFATPTVDSSGKATGYKMNQGAFNALYQVPACTAIANDPSMDAKTRESALETCLRNNKDVQFIPIGSGSL